MFSKQSKHQNADYNKYITAKTAFCDNLMQKYSRKYHNQNRGHRINNHAKSIIYFGINKHIKHQYTEVAHICEQDIWIHIFKYKSLMLFICAFLQYDLRKGCNSGT